MRPDPHAPGMLRSDADPDARPPHERTDLDAAILDEQALTNKVETVFRERDPHRHRQVAGAAAEPMTRG